MIRRVFVLLVVALIALTMFVATSSDRRAEIVREDLFDAISARVTLMRGPHGPMPEPRTTTPLVSRTINDLAVNVFRVRRIPANTRYREGVNIYSMPIVVLDIEVLNRTWGDRDLSSSLFFLKDSGGNLLRNNLELLTVWPGRPLKPGAFFSVELLYPIRQLDENLSLVYVFPSGSQVEVLESVPVEQ